MFVSVFEMVTGAWSLAGLLMACLASPGLSVVMPHTGITVLGMPEVHPQKALAFLGHVEAAGDDLHALLIGERTLAGHTIDEVLRRTVSMKFKHTQQPRCQPSAPGTHHQRPPGGMAPVQAHAVVSIHEDFIPVFPQQLDAKAC